MRADAKSKSETPGAKAGHPEQKREAWGKSVLMSIAVVMDSLRELLISRAMDSPKKLLISKYHSHDASADWHLGSPHLLEKRRGNFLHETLLRQ